MTKPNATPAKSTPHRGPRYRVEHGKPRPRPVGGFPLRKYPFDRMAIGDSFFVPTVDLPASGPSVLNAAARQRGMRASVRAEGDGHRCWRIA